MLELEKKIDLGYTLEEDTRLFSCSATYLLHSMNDTNVNAESIKLCANNYMKVQSGSTISIVDLSQYGRPIV